MTVKDDLAKLQSVLSKLKKLSMKTEAHGATPEEAASAAAKIQEMLFSYNLTMQDLEDAGEHVTEEGYTQDTIEMGKSSEWRRVLLVGLARYNFCKIIIPGNWERDMRDKVYIVGQPQNVAVVRYLYAYLRREIDRLAKVGYKAYLVQIEKEIREYLLDRYSAVDDYRFDAMMSERRPTRWEDSFRHAAAHTIGVRLREQFDKDRTASTKSTALVVSKDKQVAQATKKFFPATASHAFSAPGDIAGTLAGMAAGRAIPINRGLPGRTEAGRGPAQLGPGGR